jgi:SNF2 family DNA or RNA helicase
VPVFFLQDLAALKGVAAARLTPAAAAVEVVEGGAPRFAVDASVPGWLDFDVTYGSGQLRVPLAAAEEAVAAGEEVVEVAPGKYVRIDPESVKQTAREMEALGANSSKEGYRVQAERIGRLQDVIAGLGGEEEVTAAYQAFLAGLTGLQLDPAAPLPEAAEGALTGIGFTLRPYQRQGVQWLRWLSANGLHGLLADDMGLGKTVQTALAVRSAYEARSGDPPHSLVVCPRSVVENWAREFGKLYPELEVDIHLGDDRELEDFRRTTPRVFISSYGTLARDAEHLADLELRYLILDEASQIKNPSAQRTKAMKRLRARHRLCLTGTPIENRPGELWSLFDFLLPGHLGDHRRFETAYGEPIIAGDAAAAERLSGRIKPFILRRRKDDVAKDLPEKVELRAWCGLTPEQVARYHAVLDGSADVLGALHRGEQVSMATSILPILTRLKQVCAHPALLDRAEGPKSEAGGGGEAEGTDGDVESGGGSVPPGDGGRAGKPAPVTADCDGAWPGTIEGRSEKFDLAVERLEEIWARGEKTIVFSQFLGMLDLFERVLTERGVNYVRIDGSTTNRQALIDRLNTEADVRVALCSILATGYGINLQAANNVIHVDRWWNPATEDQATARVHRIGQARTVFVHHVLVRGTLEERIDWLLQRKREMAAGIVDGGHDAELGWTRDELLDILRPIDAAAAVARSE